MSLINLNNFDELIINLIQEQNFHKLTAFIMNKKTNSEGCISVFLITQ